MAVKNDNTREGDVRFTRITPGQAQEYIQNSEASGFKNRKISEQTVERYSKAFKDGKWDAYSSTVHIDAEGVLINGYHRMWACIMSDTGFNTILVTSPNRRQTFVNVDTGKPRTASDIIGISGWTNTHNLSAAIRLRIRHRETGYPYHNMPVSNDDVLTFCEDNESQLKNIQKSLPSAAFKITAPSKLMFLMLAARNLSRCKTFVNEVVNGYEETGNGLPKTSPSFQLREKLLAARLAKKFNRKQDTLSSAQETFIIASTYQKWLKGEKVSRVQIPRITHKGKTRPLSEAYKIHKAL
jgi:hypothetical protein